MKRVIRLVDKDLRTSVINILFIQEGREKHDKKRHGRCQEYPKQNFSVKNISLMKNTVGRNSY